jgi:acyl transferase domain-containing protein
MKTIADLYNGLITPHLAPKDPIVPYYSTVYGKELRDGAMFGSKYWQLNMESPVLFRTAVASMLRGTSADIAHLEVGPHSAMAGPLRQIYKEIGQTIPYAATLNRGDDAINSFLEAMGKLFTFGVKLEPPVSEACHTLPDLPTYPWQYDGGPYW